MPRTPLKKTAADQAIENITDQLRMVADLIPEQKRDDFEAEIGKALIGWSRLLGDAAKARNNPVWRVNFSERHGSGQVWVGSGGRFVRLPENPDRADVQNLIFGPLADKMAGEDGSVSLLERHVSINTEAIVWRNETRAAHFVHIGNLHGAKRNLGHEFWADDPKLPPGKLRTAIQKISEQITDLAEHELSQGNYGFVWELATALHGLGTELLGPNKLWKPDPGEFDRYSRARELETWKAMEYSDPPLPEPPPEPVKPIPEPTPEWAVWPEPSIEPKSSQLGTPLIKQATDPVYQTHISGYQDQIEGGPVSQTVIVGEDPKKLAPGLRRPGKPTKKPTKPPLAKKAGRTWTVEWLKAPWSDPAVDQTWRETGDWVVTNWTGSIDPTLMRLGSSGGAGVAVPHPYPARSPESHQEILWLDLWGYSLFGGHEGGFERALKTTLQLFEVEDHASDNPATEEGDRFDVRCPDGQHFSWIVEGDRSLAKAASVKPLWDDGAAATEITQTACDLVVWEADDHWDAQHYTRKIVGVDNISDPPTAFAQAEQHRGPRTKVMIFPNFQERLENGKVISRYWRSIEGEPWKELMVSPRDKPTIPYLGQQIQIPMLEPTSLDDFKF